MTIRKIFLRTSLAIQWLRLCASTAGGTGSIPGQGTKISHATQCNQKHIYIYTYIYIYIYFFFSQANYLRFICPHPFRHTSKLKWARNKMNNKLWLNNSFIKCGHLCYYKRNRKRKSLDSVSHCSRACMGTHLWGTNPDLSNEIVQECSQEEVTLS